MTKIVALALAFIAGLPGQTTQGLISGRVLDSLSGQPISTASISLTESATEIVRSTQPGDSGFYVFPLLSPGLYRLRAQADGYQAFELNQIELAVAGSLLVPIRLRLLRDVWEKEQYRSVFLQGGSVLQFYGPDADPARTGNFQPDLGSRGALEASVSEVIREASLRDLPLASRDVYALLVTLPGVTSDIATGRGLSLSVNGQRPSASNYLLDGLENNNYLVTGPLSQVTPEAIQEYRITTTNFSAEYGRTSGFLANAVTRPGGRHWHGFAWFDFKNDSLNANEFQQNTQGLPRTPLKEIRPGISVGGPLHANDLFFSASAEYLRFRSFEQPETFLLPTTNFQPPPGSLAAQLLRDYQAPTGDHMTTKVELAPPSNINQFFLLPRLDWLHGGNGSNRILARAVMFSTEEPDFVFSPYKAFSSPLTHRVVSPGAAWLWAPSALTTNEARIGWNTDDLKLNRAQPDIPTMLSDDGVSLPGSLAFYAYHNRMKSLEILDNVVHISRAHVTKFGGQALIRSIDGLLSAGRDGYYAFRDLQSFADGRPRLVRVALAQGAFDAGRLEIPNYDRTYSDRDFFLFAQDSWKISPRLVVNYGFRYDWTGTPTNTGSVKDSVIALGTGASLSDQLAAGVMQSGASGNQPLYDAGSHDWAVRLAASYLLRRDGRTLLRGGYGIFYDRLFDNLWQNIRNNGFVLGTALYDGPVITPVSGVLPMLKGVQEDLVFTKANLFSDKIATPRVQSGFLGLEHELTRSLTLMANATVSTGARLITSDIVNRDYSEEVDGRHNPRGRINPELPRVIYRANQGFSDYSGVGASARYRSGRGLFYVAWTWSHSIDNQSEPLAGDFYDLRGVADTQSTSSNYLSAFSRQFDNHIDRANSDFDQRHNLVAYWIWDLPLLTKSSTLTPALRNWKLAALFAARSGFPYTVYSGFTGNIVDGPTIYNRRADLIDPSGAHINSPVQGGWKLLSEDAFARSAVTGQGSSGRNAFHGPGFYTLDMSLARTFQLPWEGLRMTVRADAFNVLNHANLANPVTMLGSQHFGEAYYGRSEQQPAFPALTPFSESARQFQLMLRVDF